MNIVATPLPEKIHTDKIIAEKQESHYVLAKPKLVASEVIELSDVEVEERPYTNRQPVVNDSPLTEQHRVSMHVYQDIPSRG